MDSKREKDDLILYLLNLFHIKKILFSYKMNIHEYSSLVNEVKCFI